MKSCVSFSAARVFTHPGPICDEARARFARPRALSSEVNLFRESEGVVRLDAETTDCALQLAMSEHELAGAKVSRFLVDERDLGPSQAVGALCPRLKVDHGHPAVDQARIPPGADVIA